MRCVYQFHDEIFQRVFEMVKFYKIVEDFNI